jgi:Fuc2NAc and GlcNAc transferase
MFTFYPFLAKAVSGKNSWVFKSLHDFVCLSSFLFPFYADELATMVVRIKDGENLLRPHRKHLYQLLANEKGIPHWEVPLGYGLMQLAIGLTVLFLKPFGIIVILSLLLAYFAAFILVSSTIRKNLAQPC